MKKVLSLAVCALALASVAEPQKLAEITVANRATLLKQAAQFGTLTDTPMIGMMAAGMLADNPFVSDFGMPREDGVMTFSVYVNPPHELKTAADVDKIEETQACAVVYPATIGPAEFEAKQGLVATNGIYTMDIDKYAAYTSDGKWVVLGSTPEVTNLALAKAGTAKLTQDEAVRIEMPARAIEMSVTACEILMKERPDDVLPLTFDSEILKETDGLSAFLRVTEKGLDFQYSFTVKPGSTLDKIGTKPFSVPDPLAFAGKDAILAWATASDCGKTAEAATWKALGELWKKHAPAAQFVTCEEQGAVRKMTFDVKTFCDFAQSDDFGKWVEDLFGETTLAELSTILESSSTDVTVGGAESFASFAIKGESLSSTASTRFAKAMPDVKNPVSCGVASLYGGLIHALSATLSSATPADDAEKMQLEMMRGMLAMFPPEGDGCIAAAVWREGPTFTVRFRATPEEMKGLSALVNFAGSMIPFGDDGACYGPGFGEELPDDEEE